MSHTFHQLYYHFIWATHARAPIIERIWRPQFLEILNETVKKYEGLPLRHNAMPDHVHLLVRLQPKNPVSDFIGKVKGASAFRLNKELSPRFKFRWQEGYGVLSLRLEECDKVARYIDNQETHHSNNKLSAVLEAVEIENDDWQ